MQLANESYPGETVTGGAGFGGLGSAMRPIIPQTAAGRFKGSRLKIERANKHIRELQGLVEAFITRDVCSIIICDNPEGAGQFFTVRLFEETPDQFSLVIGDAAHNLRSALDIMACDLVRANGRSAASVHFPFARNVDELGAAIDKAKIKRAGPAVVRHIEFIKPCDGGLCATLAELHRLDIIDKHRLILPILGMAKLSVQDFPGSDLTGTIFEIGKTYGMVPPTFHTPLKDGLTFEAVTFLPRLQDGTELKPTFEVAFDKGPFERQAVVPTLNNLSQFVSSIIDGFEELLIGIS